MAEEGSGVARAPAAGQQRGPGEESAAGPAGGARAALPATALRVREPGEKADRLVKNPQNTAMDSC